MGQRVSQNIVLAFNNNNNKDLQEKCPVHQFLIRVSHLMNENERVVVSMYILPLARQ